MDGWSLDSQSGCLSSGINPNVAIDSEVTRIIAVECKYWITDEQRQEGEYEYDKHADVEAATEGAEGSTLVFGEIIIVIYFVLRVKIWIVGVRHEAHARGASGVF